MSPSSSRWSWVLWPGLISAAVATLAWSNPPPRDFEDFAADQLVNLAVKDVCGPQGLPMLLQLVVQDCPKLMLSQRQALGSLALALPRYRALTLAGAGQFLILQTDSGPGSPR